jgi:O-antigen/teichoic acid export membrane protein
MRSTKPKVTNPEIDIADGSASVVANSAVDGIELAQGTSRPVRASSKMTTVGAIAQSVSAKMFIIVLNALTGIITARALLPEGRGELAALVLWPVLLGTVFSLGIPSALTFQLNRDPKRESSLMGAGLLLALVSGLVGAIVGAIFLHSWIPQYSPRIIFFAQIFLVSVPLTSLLAAGRAGVESRNDFTTSNLVLIGSPALTLLWLIVLLVRGGMSPVSAALAYVVVGIVPLAWMFYRVTKILHPSFTGLRQSCRQLFSYGVRSYGIDLCGTMAFYVDQALVVRLLAPEMMGIYVVALSLARILNAFHTSVNMVLFPKAVRRTPKEIVDMASRAMRMNTLLTTVGGIFVIGAGPQLLGLLYGKEYSGANGVLRILVVQIILSGATAVLAQAFMAIGRPGIVTTLQVIGLGLTVPLMLVLIPRLGIVGAGLALLISTVVRFLFVIFSFPLFLKMPMPQLLPNRRDFVTLRDLAVSRIRRVSPASLATAGAGD